MSDRKIRIPTQESVESGNSANKYGYNNNQNIYTNLFPQIPPNINRNTPKSGSNNIVFNEEYDLFLFIIFIF